MDLPMETACAFVAWIGIDVSKETLDACLINRADKRHHKQFKNEASGFAKLLRWTRSLCVGPVHFCMESTGSYSTGLALYLAEAEQTVSVENPARVKHFGQSQGVLNKTDKADAKVIADYARLLSPAPWRMSTPEMRLLVSLLRRLSGLQELLIEEKGRFSQPGLPKEVLRSVKHTIRFLEAEIERLKDQIDSHTENHPDLKADKELLTSIPGIGDLTALWLLAELGDHRQFPSAQSVAAYAGLSPREYRSGSSVQKRTRLSKTGNARLRRALYMPAMVAVRYNPTIKAFYQHLIENGKPKMVALAAAMRKLLMIAYGVLKSRKEFTLLPAQKAA